MPRLLPSPWRAEKNSFGYVIRDANGQNLAYIPSRAAEPEAAHAGVLTDDEARIVAACIAQLPQLLRRPKSHRLLSRASVRLAAVLNKALGRQVAGKPQG